MTNTFNERTKKTFIYRNFKNQLKVLKKNFNLYFNLASQFGWGWNLVLKVPTPRDEQIWEEVISMSVQWLLIS